MNLHTHCLLTACQELGVPYQLIGDSGVFVQINHDNNPLHFITNAFPFNDYTVSQICLDKHHTYELLHPYLQMPLTYRFLDPQPHQEYLQPYAIHSNLDTIITEIKQKLTFPLIIKPNRGHAGLNTYKCTGSGDIESALNSIFDHLSPDYDYAALAQPFLKIKNEYRVIIFQRQILLTYKKEISKATFIGNLSPLHWDNAKAVIQSDLQLNESIHQFIMPIFDHLNLVYAGLDIAQDHQDKFWLLELNNSPAYHILARDNGPYVVTNLLKTMLSSLK